MDRKRWQTRKKIPIYTGYTIGYHTFCWDNVISISKVYILISDLGNVTAKFYINFTYGKPLEVFTRLESRIFIKNTKFLGFKRKTKQKFKEQDYFSNPCETLQAIESSRKQAVKAYLNFKRAIYKQNIKHIG